MRTYIGGEEKIFPARWFFCDPQAELFPSPHGAEASPWLKDGETNEWWGEIKGRKTLDRGINPGYPGLCSVGDAGWFLNGELPETVLTKEGPLTPLCCGHTPPNSLDPRCPPYHIVVDCINCEGGKAFRDYVITAKDASGPYKPMNGVWSVAHLGGCLWQGGIFGVNVIDMQVAFGIWIIFMQVPFVQTASWSIQLPANCRIPQPLWQLIGFYPDGDPPVISLE